MESIKNLKELEKELKTEKKRFDKLCKQLRRCTGAFQYETLSEEAEDVRQDIIQLQLIIQDLRRKKKEEELLVDAEA
jgi:predicted  nucleic acid-binding Zn-ribbon protein